VNTVNPLANPNIGWRLGLAFAAVIARAHPGAGKRMPRSSGVRGAQRAASTLVAPGHAGKLPRAEHQAPDRRGARRPPARRRPGALTALPANGVKTVDTRAVRDVQNQIDADVRPTTARDLLDPSAPSD